MWCKEKLQTRVLRDRSKCRRSSSGVFVDRCRPHPRRNKDPASEPFHWVHRRRRQPHIGHQHPQQRQQQQPWQEHSVTSSELTRKHSVQPRLHFDLLHKLLLTGLHIVRWGETCNARWCLSSSVGVCNTPRRNVTHRGQHAAGQ